jgi:hypothetical protein
LCPGSTLFSRIAPSPGLACPEDLHSLSYALRQLLGALGHTISQAKELDCTCNLFSASTCSTRNCLNVLDDVVQRADLVLEGEVGLKTPSNVLSGTLPHVLGLEHFQDIPDVSRARQKLLSMQRCSP